MAIWLLKGLRDVNLLSQKRFEAFPFEFEHGPELALFGSFHIYATAEEGALESILMERALLDQTRLVEGAKHVILNYEEEDMRMVERYSKWACTLPGI